MANPRSKTIFVLLSGSVFVACLSGLAVGPVSIQPLEIVRVLCAGVGEGDEQAMIIWDLRLPRLVLALLVGAALSLSGSVMQGFFQNPMADPYIIGVSSGAALGATLAMRLELDVWVAGLNVVSIFAFVGALGVTFVVYGLSMRQSRLNTSVVLLTGIAVGALASAITSFLLVSSSGGDVQRILFWLMGSLSSRRWEHVHSVLPYVVICCAVLPFYARDLNLILQGEETAQYLGVDVERVKRILLVLAALLASSAVAVSGIIGFVGLVVPHLMRLLVGPDHRKLFPASILGGATLLVASDALARTLIAPAEVPIGIITSVLGCPFFLYLLARRRRVML